MSVILVPVDGSESGERAVLRAADLATERGGSVVVLHVVPTTFERERVAQIDPASTDVEEAFAQDVVDRALTLLAERGIRAEGKILEGAPAQVILAQIGALSASVVVMGSRGLQNVMPEGSVSRRVREQTDVAVEVVD